MSDHDQLRELSAAYVLGALSPDDRAVFEEHLETCDRCQADTLDFAPIPGLLAQLDVDDLEPADASDQASLVVARARSDLARLRESRQRWRIVAGAAAAMAILAGAVAMLVDPGGTASSDLAGVTLAIESASAVTGEIVADERSWGTYVHVALGDLPDRDLYRLWAVDESGVWHEAGSWLPTPDSSARLGGSTHLRLAEIALLIITSDDPDDQLLTAD